MTSLGDMLTDEMRCSTECVLLYISREGKHECVCIGSVSIQFKLEYNIKQKWLAVEENRRKASRSLYDREYRCSHCIFSSNYLHNIKNHHVSAHPQHHLLPSNDKWTKVCRRTTNDRDMKVPAKLKIDEACEEATSEVVHRTSTKSYSSTGSSQSLTSNQPSLPGKVSKDAPRSINRRKMAHSKPNPLRGIAQEPTSHINVRVLPKTSSICEICGVQCGHENLKEIHMRTNHCKNNSYHCPHCEMDVPCVKWKQHQQNHIKEKSEDRPYCAECKKYYKSNRNLRDHRLEVHGEGPDYYCPVQNCHKVFKRQRNLNVHLQRHEGRKNQLCHFCGEGYNTRSALVKHIQTKHPDDVPVDINKPTVEEKLAHLLGDHMVPRAIVASDVAPKVSKPAVNLSSAKKIGEKTRRSSSTTQRSDSLIKYLTGDSFQAALSFDAQTDIDNISTPVKEVRPVNSVVVENPGEIDSLNTTATPTRRTNSLIRYLEGDSFQGDIELNRAATNAEEPTFEHSTDTGSGTVDASVAPPQRVDSLSQYLGEVAMETDINCPLPPESNVSLQASSNMAVQECNNFTNIQQGPPNITQRADSLLQHLGLHPTNLLSQPMSNAPQQLEDGIPSTGALLSVQHSPETSMAVISEDKVLETPTRRTNSLIKYLDGGDSQSIDEQPSYTPSSVHKRPKLRRASHVDSVTAPYPPLTHRSMSTGDQSMSCKTTASAESPATISYLGSTDESILSSNKKVKTQLSNLPHSLSEELREATLILSNLNQRSPDGPSISEQILGSSDATQ